MSLDEALPVVGCAGVPITACRPDEAAAEVVRLASAERKTGLDVHLVNAYTLALADKDHALRVLLRNAGRNYPDGKSVVWANRLQYRDRSLPTARVYGPDLFLDVLDAGRVAGLRHVFLGATPRVLQDLQAITEARFPTVQIVGTISPPFRALTPAERQEQDSTLAAMQPHIIWVGLGTPKQDVEAARLATTVPAITVAVGAAFDFVSGNKRQAPGWLGRAGLEWLYRLAAEPRRLWRRYLLGNVTFVCAVVRTRPSTRVQPARRS
jgi:N-acetylglucosaminyldiphosphoundecaprenol N-acetyl-beta-D-mannosaminyltransferase